MFALPRNIQKMVFKGKIQKNFSKIKSPDQKGKRRLPNPFGSLIFPTQQAEQN